MLYDDPAFTNGKSPEQADAERVNHLTVVVREEWARIDAHKIQEQGLDTSGSSVDGLAEKIRTQYESDDHQIRYAKAHAQELLDALKKMRADEKEYPVINDENLRKALRLRVLELAERTGRVVSLA